MSGADPVIHEWVTWAWWRGSPKLIAHIVRVAITAVASGDLKEDLGNCSLAVSCLITAVVRADVEQFRSTEEFLERITPEALRHASRFDAVIRGGHTEVFVRFIRARRTARQGRGKLTGPRVELEVRSLGEANQENAARIGRAICAAIARGHRRWWGQVEGSDALSASWQAPELPRHLPIVFVMSVAIGVVLGIALAATLDVLFPKLDRHFVFPIVVATAAFYAVLLEVIIPKVEIAEPGSTRTDKAVRWTVATLSALFVTLVGKRIIGS